MPRSNPQTHYTMAGPHWRGLAKLMEEMAELQVNLAKLIVNHGETDYWDKIDLWGEIADEAADVAAALQWFVNKNDFDMVYIEDRMRRKLEKYESWEENNE